MRKINTRVNLDIFGQQLLLIYVQERFIITRYFYSQPSQNSHIKQWHILDDLVLYLLRIYIIQTQSIQPMQALKSFKLALLQTKCVPNKQHNLQYIREALRAAGQNGAQISVLGEICNSPYTKDFMISFAEDFKDSQTLKLIQEECLQSKMYAIGTIPRKHDIGEGKFQYYNTAFVVNPEGKLHAQMDKIHLFDIDIPGKITYKQSDTFKAGNKICVFDTEFCKIGLGICYDLRFAELGLLMAQQGARVLIYPGSFNQTTGPLHWQLLLRGRALDTQSYTVGVSCAQYKEDPKIYQAWGHSTAVDPFGKVISSLDENPGISYCEINPDYTEEVRTNIPLRNQKRKDLYKLEQLN